MTTTGDKVLAFLQGYNLKDKHNGNYRSYSPLRPHSDSLSFSVTIEPDGEHGVFMDFVTGESGSLYQLANELGIELPKDYTPKENAPKRVYEPKPPKPPVYYNHAWRECLQDNAPRSLQEWLARRGINSQTAWHFDLGYTGNDKNLPDWAHHKLTIPWWIEGKVVGVKLRSLPDSNAKLKYISLENSDFNHWYNWTSQVNPPAQNHKNETIVFNTRFIQEGELDAIAMCALCQDDTLSLASPASAINPFKAGLLVGYRVGMVLDRDKAGKAMLAKAREFIPDITPFYAASGCKDLGESLQNRLMPKWMNDYLYTQWTALEYPELDTHFTWEVKPIEPTPIETPQPIEVIETTPPIVAPIPELPVLPVLPLEFPVMQNGLPTIEQLIKAKYENTLYLLVRDMSRDDMLKVKDDLRKNQNSNDSYYTLRAWRICCNEALEKRYPNINYEDLMI